MRILFVHHSVGRYILSRGDLRSRLAKLLPSHELWDHDYNKIGMTDNSGAAVSGGLLPVPNDDTDPPGVEAFLSMTRTDSEFGEKMADFDVLMFKSCYPNSDIKSDEELGELKRTYERIADLADVIDQRFVLLTSPPLVREVTSQEAAGRARSLAQWLDRDLQLAKGTVIDVYSTLAAESGWAANTLRPSYRKPWPFDSHPNRAGSSAAAEQLAVGLADFLK